MDTKEGPPDGCRDATAKLLTRVVAYSIRPEDTRFLSGGVVTDWFSSVCWPLGYSIMYSLQSDLVVMLSKEVRETGSAKAVAEKYHISEQYLSDVLKGHRMIGERLAAELGYKRMIVYVTSK